MPSKQITDRQKSAAAVIAAAQSHGPRVAEAFDALFQPVAIKGQRIPDAGQMFALCAAALEVATARLIEADVTHEQELADDEAPRAKRDELTDGLYADIVELREVATGLLGASSLSLLRLTGPTPRDPVVLSRLARDVSSVLSTQKLPKSRVRGATFHAADWIERLDDRSKQLDKAIATVAREAREAEATITAKNKAMVEFDDTFRRVATLLSAALSIAGEAELAARVRPTARRPGRNAEAGDSEPEARATGSATPATNDAISLAELEPSS